MNSALALSSAPAAVRDAFANVRAACPGVESVTFKLDPDGFHIWEYENGDGSAPSFDGLDVDVGLLEDALDAVEDVPITYRRDLGGLTLLELEPKGQVARLDSHLTDLAPAEQNDTRASWAELALDVFSRETFDKSFDRALKDGDGEDAFSDLLCNLRHVAKARGLDFADLDRRGAANFDHENAPDYAGD